MGDKFASPLSGLERILGRRNIAMPHGSSFKTAAYTLIAGVSIIFGQPALGQRRPAESIQPGDSTVILGGWVHADYTGNIPSNVNVKLATSEGMIGGEQSINASGYFEFVGLAKTYYHLTITAPGFQLYQQDIDLRSVGDKLTINIQLSPSMKTRAPAPPASPSYTDDTAPRKAKKEYQKGRNALQDGKFFEAQSHLEKSVQEYPCYARAQTDLAVALSQQHQLSESETPLKKALQCDPDYLDAYIELAQLYYNEKKYQESELVAQDGLRRSPGAWQFYYQLGADHYHLGLYAKAEQEYLKAQTLSASVPAEIHVKLADVYLKQAAYDKAYHEMGAYLLLEPGGRFAPELKRVMQKMESDHILTASHPSGEKSPPPRH
jgi:tetratricopeptide (TPR) repeat protein